MKTLNKQEARLSDTFSGTRINDIFNWATVITFLRYVLTPVSVYLIIENEHFFALLVLIVAAITDFLDGWVARTFNCRTPIGEKLDGKADKIWLVLIFFFSPVTASLVLILEILGNEFSTIVRKYEKKHYIAPGSKYITAIQFILLGCLISNKLVTPIEYSFIVEIAILLSMIMLSYRRMIIYMNKYLKFHKKLQKNYNFFTLANYITILGLLFIPVIIWLYQVGESEVAILLYGIAWLTDLFDGQVAKRRNEQTTIGARLDVIRDKALLMLAVIICWPQLWFILLLVFFEAISLTFFLLRKKVLELTYNNSVIQESRITTVIQSFLLVSAFAMNDNLSHFDLQNIGKVILMASCFRAIMYMITYIQSKK